jgi:hypothetical protein
MLRYFRDLAKELLKQAVKKTKEVGGGRGKVCMLRFIRGTCMKE